VVKAERGRQLTIRDLPAGTYGIKCTTPESYSVDLDDSTLNDSTLTTRIPDEGIITISTPSQHHGITLSARSATADSESRSGSSAIGVWC
jgi:hypothetical protein